MYVEERNNSKLMWIIAGGLIAVILLIAGFFWLNHSSETAQNNEQIHQTAPTKKYQKLLQLPHSPLSKALLQPMWN